MKNKLSFITKTAFAIAAASALVASREAKALTNLPVVSVIASDPVALEGTSTASFTLLRYGSTNTSITVALGISGTASNGVDYASISNKITIPAGDLAVDVPVVPILDLTNRGNKTVVLTVLSNAAYSSVFYKKAEVKIIDDAYNIPAPTVLLTSPTNGSTYTNPAVVTLVATASDPDVAITNVSFFANDDFLGKGTVKTNGSYTLTWTNKCGGHYALFARAVDTVDQSAVSAPVSITISNAPPVIPTNGPSNHFGRP